MEFYALTEDKPEVNIRKHIKEVYKPGFITGTYIGRGETLEYFDGSEWKEIPYYYSTITLGKK